MSCVQSSVNHVIGCLLGLVFFYSDGAAMDDFEKMMFRRRKQYICDTIQMTSELVADLRSVGLLTSDVIAMINVSGK